MTTDPTEVQGGAERQRSRDMSLKRGHPPTQVPGYEPERFLGLGTYGEVWVAVERNTGRKVAIKFYAHRGGLDWSLLASEVEKLAFLFADRYVVQLIGVGWDADPPFFIMEYLEKGSLADRIAQGPVPVDQAVSLFRDVATGLAHAHGKGVLHCDLKPANVLLDQDGKPRLADFGQSRLSSEQASSLGTMFYMAPEQADLDAVPDARWDVYALGALLYCMLTGGPPHRTGKTLSISFEQTPELNERLVRYRQTIEQSPLPLGHRKTPGVDKLLAAIVDRCLAPDPKNRFPNVQAVLDALDERASRLARRPIMMLGAVGPALLLAVVAWFAWQGFHAAVQQSNAALTRRALEANRFAAQFVARTAAYELEHRYQLVEQVATSEVLRKHLAEFLAKPDIRKMMRELSDPKRNAADLEPLREQYRKNPERLALQNEFAATISSIVRPDDEEEAASWFFCDADGVSTVRVPEGGTIGKNFAWRSYFHGGPGDLDETWRPELGKHLRATMLSDVFRSKASSRWTVAISTPVYDDSPEKKFLGVLAMTVRVGQFVKFPGNDNQFAVLANNREGKYRGVVLQHPLFDAMLEKQSDLPPGRRKLPNRVEEYRVNADVLLDKRDRFEDYIDPMAADPEGGNYDQRWLACMKSVRVRGEKTGWMVIVQEAYNTAIGETLEKLTGGLIRSGLIALGLIALVMAGLWGMAKRMSV